MRLVIQRVSSASVTTPEGHFSAIGKGLLVFAGIEETDLTDDVVYAASKLCSMRIFGDAEEKMNLDVKQINGEVMVISQFTLHALTKKGNRPSFIKAARPETAIPLFEAFIFEVEQRLGKRCARGVFGANMQVKLVNDGPVTIILDSKNRE